MWRYCHFSHYTRRLSASMLIISLVVGFMLAACGSNTTTTTGGQPTPPPPRVNCGNVQSSHFGIEPSEKATIQKAENCFYQAYQQCQPATLTFTTFGIDAGAIHHFSVKGANTSCTISDGVQNYIAPKPPSAATMYTCSTMSQQSDGLHIQKCGKLGTIVIPLA